MIKFKDFLLENKIEPKIGCVMLYFEIDNWIQIIKQYIDKDDLYKHLDDDFGLCKYPHTTILFGIHHNDDLPNQVKEYLIPLDELEDIYIKNISIFENEEFDVVKMDIESKSLKKMNKKLTKNFEFSNDHPDYHPHMTIAYVKKGMGDKYKTKITDKIVLEPGKYVYSSPAPEYKKTTIKV